MQQRAAPKKRLGQHFLVSQFYAERIADSIEASSDETVVEIGPGRGAVSRYLKERFPSFHCVEIDSEVVAGLRETLGGGEWSLHVGNILDFDFEVLGSRFHAVGNLPYNMGARIIRKVLYQAPRVVSCTFMVQREVAERITAKPGTKRYGFPTVLCGFFGVSRILFHVPPGAFFPKPNVNSSVFRLRVNPAVERRLPSEQWDQFFGFVDRGFSMRRKMLVNVLGREGGKEYYRRCLEELSIPVTARPEALNVDEWVGLYRKVRQCPQG
ncbi:MAG: ribosomal RNA small subunit methyltransferase A [Chitinivibrionales bacterium]|nr:ribosomal RNA small subunit methyltransferase A [Chitinivibrionales bacterium]